MFKRTFFVIGIAATLVAAGAYAQDASTVLTKVKVDKAASFEKVVGVQTYSGQIVSGHRISDEIRRNFSTLPSVREVLDKEEIELSNGQVIRAEDLQYFYLQREQQRLSGARPESREPSTDED